MARKGQKFNKYSKEFKEEVLKEYMEGEGTSRQLGRKYEISYKTIETWIYQYKHSELRRGKKRGRPKSTGETDYKERYEILKKYQTFLKAQREKR